MISIIVPIYNSQNYLSQCIESISSQSFNDWELLLVDDGSTDSSKSICEFYVGQDNRIKYIYQPNKGVSAARNTGINNARGQWIAFIDSDDSINTDYLIALYNHVGCNEMIACGYQANSKRGVDLVKFQNCILNRDRFSEYFSYPNWGFVWGRLFDRLFLINNNIYFDEDITFREDNIFIEEVLSKANSITLIDDCLYQYKICDEGTSPKINEFDKELYAFNKAKSAAKELVASLGEPKLYKNLNLFGFLYHVILSIYKPQTRPLERIAKLKKLNYSTKIIYPVCHNWKEYVLFILIKHKIWHLYDILASKALIPNS